MPLDTIAKRLIWLREDRGFKKKFVAESISVGVRTVQKHEKGDSAPNPNTVRRYIAFYKCDKDWLKSGQGEPYIEPESDMSYQTEDAVPHMLDKPEGAVEDKYGLWGDTRRGEYAGKKVDVISYGPEEVPDPALVDAFSQAVAGLKEIFYSRDPILIPAIEANIRAFRLSARRERQVAQQAREIEKLKEECVELKDRIAALEDKHKPKDPHEHDHESKRSTAT